jgi:hypothetical protein
MSYPDRDRDYPVTLHQAVHLLTDDPLTGSLDDAWTSASDVHTLIALSHSHVTPRTLVRFAYICATQADTTRMAQKESHALSLVDQWLREDPISLADMTNAIAAIGGASSGAAWTALAAKDAMRAAAVLAQPPTWGAAREFGQLLAWTAQSAQCAAQMVADGNVEVHQKHADLFRTLVRSPTPADVICAGCMMYLIGWIPSGQLIRVYATKRRG